MRVHACRLCFNYVSEGQLTTLLVLDLVRPFLSHRLQDTTDETIHTAAWHISNLQPKQLEKYIREFGEEAPINLIDQTTLSELCQTCWVFPKIMGNPPKSSILIGFGTIINHPFWGTGFLETPSCTNGRDFAC